MKKSARYWIRKHKNSVAIYKQEVRGESPTESIQHPTLETINKELESGSINMEMAVKMAKELLGSLKPKKPKRVFGGANADLLDRYWEEVLAYKEHEDPSAAKNRLIRGVNAVGSLSLHVATKEQLLKAIQGNSRKREAAAVINQLLKYLGRPFTLPTPKKDANEVTYLPESDFLRVLKSIKEVDNKLFFATLFYTGCRVGEAFALARTFKGGKVIFIEKQIKRDLQSAGLKNRRQVPHRRAVVDSSGIDFVRGWISISKQKKEKMRNLRFSEIFQEACKKADAQTITCNGLRHSYAVHWLEKGASITHVAQLLGNSEAVCQRHYAGFTVKDIGVDALLSL